MSVLEIINGNTKQNKKLFDLPITTLNANESQLSVIKELEKNNIISVLGAAGVGKTATIVNTACHFLAQNKTVLIVASSDEAVDVVAKKINDLCGMDICLRAGRSDSNIKLASKLMDAIEGKINLKDENNMNLLKYLLFERNNTGAKKLLKTQTIKRLNDLLNNTEYRKNLIVQAKMNLTKKQSKKEKLMKEIDFTPILKAYPCWAITVSQLSACLPLIKDMFTVGLIDEGSMGSIGEYIPVFHRCSKIACFGDPKQISKLLFLENKKNISFMTKYEIPEDLQLVWNYKNNSIWDFVNYYADKTILLNEYYRGYASIFKFSNEHFYGNQIKVMTKDKADAVQKIKVNGEFNNGINLIEIEKVVSIVKDIIKECKMKNEVKTIGILSPIRKQCETISKVLSEILTYDLIEKYQIECSTAHGFQGNQKSIMINSWVYADNSPYQTLTFISHPNLLNVAITRAEEKVINIYSTDNMKDSLVGQYLASIK